MFPIVTTEVRNILHSFIQQVVVALLVTPIGRIGASKIDASSFIEAFAEDNGRLLKKVKKSKAPASNKKKSKSPSKSSCFSTAQSAQFISALTAAVNSGARTIELVICNGNTIDIPSPIILTFPNSQRRLIQGKPIQVTIRSDTLTATSGLHYSGINPAQSVITFFGYNSDVINLTLPSPLTVSTTTARVNSFFGATGPFLVSTASVQVGNKIRSIVENILVEPVLVPKPAPAPVPVPAPAPAPVTTPVDPCAECKSGTDARDAILDACRKATDDGSITGTPGAVALCNGADVQFDQNNDWPVCVPSSQMQNLPLTADVTVSACTGAATLTIISGTLPTTVAKLSTTFFTFGP